MDGITANECQYRTESVLVPVAFYERTLEMMCSDWSFRRCRGHPLSLFRGLDFNWTKSMWSKWALVWWWTEATSFCSGRKSRCSKNQASYLNVAYTTLEDGIADEQSWGSRCGALRNRGCRYLRRSNINVESSKEYVGFNSNYAKLTHNISTSEEVLTRRTASIASQPPKIPPNSLTSIESGTTRLPWASLVIQNYHEAENLTSPPRSLLIVYAIKVEVWYARRAHRLKVRSNILYALREGSPSDAFITRKPSKVNVK
jgi:hypothetical protein